MIHHLTFSLPTATQCAVALSIGFTGMAAQALAQTPATAPSAQGTRAEQRAQDHASRAHETAPSARPAATTPSGAARQPDLPRKSEGGSDTRDSKGRAGSTTGSTGNGGMQGSGATSGSGGGADLR